MQLHSIQVAQPETIAPASGEDQPWVSGFFKQPVVGKVRLGKTGLEGDGQADRKNHGGPDKAVCVYSIDHHPAWLEDIEIRFPSGGFGENFSVSGAIESEVCVGDIFSVGPARLQISQPRQPCWKLGRRWQRPDLPTIVETNGRTGWYFRVLRAGLIEAPSLLTLESRPHPEWTVAAANRVLHHDKRDAVAAANLAACPALSEAWKTVLLKRARRLGHRP